ncbi:MAG: hypothetical protein QGH11_00220 [Pirellulaceae bacterium]|jgi:hypothetical protein|nr:hypothetical protein [Pirellulaceae bacterium]
MPTLACLFTLLCFPFIVAAEPPQAGTPIKAGQGILLGEINPQLKSLKKADLTLEIWIRPDQATLARPRALLWLFTNKSGSDVAGISLSTAAGRLQSNVLGSKLSSTTPLAANEWTHVCLTVTTRKLNKVATLWVQGQRSDRTLVPRPWPGDFFYTRLMSDPWGLSRVFTGEVGPIRVSSQVLYQEDFNPTSDWSPSDSTLLLLQPDQVRVTE